MRIVYAGCGGSRGSAGRRHDRGRALLETIIDSYWPDRRPALRFLRRYGSAIDRLAADVGAPLYARSLWMRTTLAATPADRTIVVPLWDRPSIRLSGLVIVAVRADGTIHNLGPRVPFCLARSPEVAHRAVSVLAQLTSRPAHPGATLDIEPSDQVAEVIPAYFPGSVIEPGHQVPALRLEPGATLSDLIGSGMVSQVGRARRRAAADGLRLRCELVTGSAIGPLLSGIAELHRARDHSRGVASDIDGLRAYRAWRETIQLTAATGQAVGFLLRLNEELAAYAIAFLDGGVLRVFDGRSSPRWSRYSPGRVAEAQLIQWAIDTGTVTLIDWMSPDHPEALIGWNCVQRYDRHRLPVPVPLAGSAAVSWS